MKTEPEDIEDPNQSSSVPRIVRRLHSLPVGGDEPLHICSHDCWCYPVQDTEQPGLWIHNAKDCREAKERAGRTDMLSVDSLWVLAFENVRPNVKTQQPRNEAPDHE